MLLIVGLGNPGKEYEKTRHNMGFLVLDSIKEKLSLGEWKTKFNGLFINTIPVRVNAEEEITVSELLKKQQKQSTNKVI